MSTARYLLVAAAVGCAPKHEARAPTPIAIHAEPESVAADDEPVARANPTEVFLDVIQEDASTRVRDGDIVRLERFPFAFRFPLRAYTDEARHVVQLAASADRTLLASVEPGPVSALAADGPFGPGTGLAAHEDGYHELFLDARGHHYLFYGTAGASRVRRIEQLAADSWLVEFAVPRIRWQGISYNPGQLPLRRIHCALLANADLGDTVSSGELIRFTLDLGEVH